MNSRSTTGYIKAGKRAWSHKSVLALLCAHPDIHDPERIIIEKAQTLVDEAINLGWSGPPFDPETLASLRGIEVTHVDESIGSEARIFPKANGAVEIEVNAGYPKARVNFSICHEIVHTFFPDCYEEIRHRNRLSPDERKHWELEYLCDVGAAELLMPLRTFAADLSRLGTFLSSIRRLEGLYNASAEAVMIRVAQLSDAPCAVIFLSERISPAEGKSSATMEFDFGLEPLKPKFRVDYVCRSKTCRLFVPQHKSAPAHSIVYRASTEEAIEAVETWNIPGFGTRKVQAIALPTRIGSPKRVAVLFTHAAEGATLDESPRFHF